jgi:hypothetical protein
MTDDELIKLLEPCTQLCRACGAQCCKHINCGQLKDNQCTARNTWCLMLHCGLMRQKFPEITEALDQEARERFPEAAKRGLTPNLKIENLPEFKGWEVQK